MNQPNVKPLSITLKIWRSLILMEMKKCTSHRKRGYNDGRSKSFRSKACWWGFIFGFDQVGFWWAFKFLYRSFLWQNGYYLLSGMVTVEPFECESICWGQVGPRDGCNSWKSQSKMPPFLFSSHKRFIYGKYHLARHWLHCVCGCGLNVACSAAVFYKIGIGSGGCYWSESCSRNSFVFLFWNKAR